MNSLAVGSPMQSSSTSAGPVPCTPGQCDSPPSSQWVNGTPSSSNPDSPHRSHVDPVPCPLQDLAPPSKKHHHFLTGMGLSSLARAFWQPRRRESYTGNGLDGLERYSSWFNALLICASVGAAAYALKFRNDVVFSLCFVGMIALGMHLSRAAEDIAVRTDNAIGAMVNVACNNAVVIVFSLAALRAGRVTLTRGILAGSMLSNLLFVLGSASLWGGMRNLELLVSSSVSESNADMLAFLVFVLVIPAALDVSVPDNDTKQIIEENFSLVVSICLLVMYFLYMFFQLRTDELQHYENSDVEKRCASPTASHPLLESTVQKLPDEPEAAEKIPSLVFSSTMLIITLAAVYALSELLVKSIDGFSAKTGLGMKFIATVLLPVIGNAVEHLSAIVVAGQNKIDVSIGIACGSSVQIAMFATPILVLISWIFTSATLTFTLPRFDIVLIVLSVYIVNMILRNSMLNWVKGAVLITCYVIAASAFFFDR